MLTGMAQNGSVTSSDPAGMPLATGPRVVAVGAGEVPAVRLAAFAGLGASPGGVNASAHRSSAGPSAAARATVWSW